MATEGSTWERAWHRGLRHPRLRGLLRELPLLLGLSIGWALVLGRSGPRACAWPEGSDWETYLDNAAFLWRPWVLPDLGFQHWRKPLHAWLVGLLGESLGYLDAALLITLLSCLAIVLAAATLGRVFGNAGAGGLSALIVADSELLGRAGCWVNNYPLAAALAASHLTLAAVCFHLSGLPPKKRTGLLLLALSLLAGVLGGLACAADPRGVAFLPASLALLGASFWVSRLPWRTRALSGMALVLGVTSSFGVDPMLRARHRIEPQPVTEQVKIQHDIGITRATRPGNPRAEAAALSLREACRGAPASGRRLPTGPCASAFRADNRLRLDDEGFLPTPLQAGLALLLLLPGRRRGGSPADASSWGWLHPLGGLLLLAGTMLPLGVLLSLVSCEDRYLLPFAAPIAAMGPAALARGGALAGVLLRRPRAFALLALAFAFVVFLGDEPARWQLEQRTSGLPLRERQVTRALASWARETIGPEDLLLDCGGRPIFEILLPGVVPMRRAPAGAALCEAWAAHPPKVPGTVFMLTLDEHRAPPGERASRALELPGWTLEERSVLSSERSLLRWSLKRGPTSLPPGP